MGSFLRPALALLALAAAPAAGGPLPDSAGVLVANDGRLLLVDPATRDTTDLGVRARSYDWSHDGSAIVFAADRGRARPPGSLWVMRADGSGRHRVAPSIASAGPPEWSPTGTMITFTRVVSPTATSLYVVRPDGSGLRRLIRGPNPTNPHWSPSGRRLLYLNGRPSRRALYVVDVRTGSSKRLVDRVHYYSDPGWSPDGSMISYVKQRRLFVARANGSRPRRLSGLVVWGAPSWAPDGSRIAFESRRGPAYRSDIWTVRPDGSGPRRLTYTGDVYEEDTDPVWSPDATKIAFVSTRNRPEARFRDDLYIMNSDGSCQTPLVGAEFLGAPRWRPQGDSGPPITC